MYNISGKTKVCAIIGDPVEHTMSPVMHNAAFREMELDFIYVAFRVRPDELTKAVDGMRALGIRGINVTIPHKVNVIPLLDRLDPSAEKTGAVNTIVNDEGILTGFNTDGYGFLQALFGKGIDPEGKNIAVLGAGGAARAAVFTLADKKANIVILNRASGMDRAKKLAALVTETAKYKIDVMVLDNGNLADVLKKSDILVNTTSVGMSPDNEKSLVPAELLKPKLTVFDIVYNPVNTRLLRDAAAAGAETINGVDMLVWQGARAFEIWTGKKPPVELMKKEVITLLQPEELL